MAAFYTRGGLTVTFDGYSAAEKMENFMAQVM